jgi:hypothetical protein
MSLTTSRSTAGGLFTKVDVAPGPNTSLPALVLRVEREGHSVISSLKIKYQLIKIVTTQPAIPVKNTTSKMRMIPI